MKKFISNIVIGALTITAIQAQNVGINTPTPDPSAILEVYSTSKGVNFPHVYLNSRTDKTTITNPEESLIVFNTNPNLIGKEGYYYWSGEMWEFLFSGKNKDVLEHLTKYYSHINDASTSFSASTAFKGIKNHIIGETFSDEWTVISAPSSTITIDRNTNQNLFTYSGIMHINNSSTLVGTTFDTTFGFFINDKLVAVKPYVFNLSQACAYDVFNFYFASENLPVGTHSVKVAVRHRTNNTGSSSFNIVYGGKNPSCTNLFNDESVKLSTTIFISQPIDKL
ncbi:hypothetical protein [Riemerella anatipestifer]|uniref:Uncharacterized protein n=1 Tax=Riemerella anatipestifer TaxID=34085 RepID=A0AAP6HFF2_RIEAN|nr:hypothetical protein [Riemerella anatipestifer]MBT0549103.1 hypothetical protein [Riemerella anatipestifer]MBT0556100.1 hypothetical protein [Riemerella anatipestifer]MBT0559866.1 hypothetical protein [Riemerella anatipestifer]MCD5969074.1 hypothetical protein [Riemerella anatipestifer]MCO7354467.1 hypothetical protein [Riemerella anatipestifer]